MSTIDLRVGDCLAVLSELPDESVSVVICDPPYGLAEHKPERVAAALIAWTSGDRDHVPAGAGGFMGRAWDTFVPPPAVWDECLRVLKPGGHLAAFAGSRTYDLMGVSIRLAGFEIRDGLQWLYGSGMPKGQNVGKAIDKTAGAEREVVGTKVGQPGYSVAPDLGRGVYSAAGRSSEVECAITAPATPEAVRWEGWNTSLRPAHEPIVLARKPLSGTVAANVLAHGTGALNVDACRVEGIRDRTEYGLASATRSQGSTYGTPTASADFDGNKGRWPSNVLLTHAPECHEPGECAPGCVVAELDAQSGILKAAGSHGRGATDVGFTRGARGQEIQPSYGDEGGASRFFPTFRHDETGCAPGCPVAELDAQSGTSKSSDRPRRNTAEAHNRTASMGKSSADWTTGGHSDEGGASRFFPSFRYQAKAPAAERPKIDGKGWPTVKPQGLMRWLVRLLTPPGGVVLDPFAGTGSTLQAARDEGFDSIGIERDEFAYLLAQKRLHADLVSAPPRPEPKPTGAPARLPGQIDLFDLLDEAAS